MNKKFIEQEYKAYVNALNSVYGKDETLSSQLITICRKFFNTNFKGVFPIDLIPYKDLKNHDFLIFNLDKHNQPGSHWCAMYKFDNNIYVYDSFGRKVLKNNKQVINSELDAEQKKSEKNCGQRCIAWLLIAKKYGIKNAIKI